MQQRSALWAILVGGTIGGALDIIYATTFWSLNGVPVERVLQAIAAGVLGKPAFTGGMPVALLGLALHFAMSYGFATAFLLASQRLSLLQRRPVWTGVGFGICVYLFMNFVVLPLSALPRAGYTFRPLASTLDILSHMFLFGVPIALACAAAARSRQAVPT
jgi:uncharacterized membrane protein YagU involved in acid resistance